MTNQSHICVSTTIDDLFIDKPDDLVIAFDTIYQTVMNWKPCTVGASTKTVVFTNHKAWLIIRPMKKELDIKFYYDEPLDSSIYRKVYFFSKKYAHHIRISNEHQVTKEVTEALRNGYEFALDK